MRGFEMTASKLRNVLAMFTFMGMLTGCATVSLEQPKSYSTAITDTDDTALGQDAANKTAQHDNQSGFYPLIQGMDALGTRLRLAEKAEKSIDLQYFLMKNDTAGAVMANALLNAADRGVRVRFLLDDVFTTVPDDSFLLINKHPNIEIRIFNPVSRSGIYAFNFVGQFDRANRRMHNKSFTVDHSISVVGGRNIADEYFQLKANAVFVDLDVLAVGPIAAAISESFDQYWNHALAVPIEQFIKDEKSEDLGTIRAEIADELDGIYDTVYKKALSSQLLQDLIADRKPLYFGPAWVLSDDPDKLMNVIDDAHMKLAQDLGQILEAAEKEILFISPYYVPGESGVQFVRDLVAKGVRVVILTNSLASTNHVPVHSAYARYRRDVIRAGVELYEMRANAARELSGNDDDPDALTLHTKAILIDHRTMFIGSLNLDPRSIEINAEMGLLIDSESMARDFTTNGDERMATLAYRVLENDAGRLEWHARIDNQDVIETKEPLTGWWRRFKAWFMKIAPESQM
jgi:putative cardiolipin synthase